jgi:hypothetical protein
MHVADGKETGEREEVHPYGMDRGAYLRTRPLGHYPARWVSASWQGSPATKGLKRQFGVPARSAGVWLLPMAFHRFDLQEPTLSIGILGHTFQIPIAVEVRDSGVLSVSLTDELGIPLPLAVIWPVWTT